MDEKVLELKLAEELISGWDIIPTGNGYLVATDWKWPNNERIEIHVRTVGEREDLYLVTDGGELFNLLFAEQVDLTKDENGSKLLDTVAEEYGAKVVDFQVARGANEQTLPQAIRMILEALKAASFLLWHKVGHKGSVH